MCGILFTNSPFISKQEFLEALGLMIHRGPDKSLCFQSHDEFKLGHNRLAIIDLDNRSNQPYYSHDNKHVIIYNGEIYNYKELANHYKLNLSTSSDTEVIIELYNKYGNKILKEFNGIFVFVILDIEKKKIFIARDRLGVKPLYFSISDGNFIFSSEISAILFLIKDYSIDKIGLRQYRKMRTFFNGRTLYSKIRMFPPGSYFWGNYFENNKIKTYWEFPNTQQEPPSDEELFDLINSSIKYRLVSDVPVGSYLSGGLDSTIVAGLSKTKHTWTVGTKANNEFEFAELAAKKYGTNHHEIIYTSSDFVDAAKFMLSIRKEPLSVPNEVVLFLMTKEVKQHNTVILSGEGADELFFGYDRIFRWAANLKEFDVSEFSKYYSYGSDSDIDIVEDAISPFLKYGTPINIVAAFFQVAHLHGLLRRLDNSTMLCSVEAREPFVDYRLVERMAGVSFGYRMNKGEVKAPLKRVFKYLIPYSIIHREKIGFPIQLDEVLPKGMIGNTSMDRWFNFNLENLGINLEEDPL